jgi:hypothetical protein
MRCYEIETRVTGKKEVGKVKQEEKGRGEGRINEEENCRNKR